MKYVLCCPECGCEDLVQNENSHYVCQDCSKENFYEELEAEEY